MTGSTPRPSERAPAERRLSGSDSLIVPLTPRQRLAAALYGDGQTDAQIALQMNITVGTLRSMIRDVRLRYRAAGRPAPTKTSLRLRLLEDGYLRD
jgi:DNA-binding CsgD family transcriptional regulator